MADDLARNALSPPAAPPPDKPLIIHVIEDQLVCLDAEELAAIGRALENAADHVWSAAKAPAPHARVELSRALADLAEVAAALGLDDLRMPRGRP